ncbi:ClbS/DfsB family four-helix bundle protein [Clostridium intestinale]|uniref:ClbS/DfsB family four-helix bundle protein n=1 Tax=Clostridium intestinale TaxID=36845 RepID=UPI002DD62D81|nr:ClbS/DfsB family four-helix bundle protein [Clostridium intestinale]WRY52111.1 ClbS/DfsB family four-helix bundle protein [Clostridium intestinale]
MQEYSNKDVLINEIKKRADLFINEFNGIAEKDKDTRYDEVDRTPQEMIAYQLGWMGLLRSWDSDELEGKEVITPTTEYKWNKLGALYQSFYDKYKDNSLTELCELFTDEVDSLTEWLNEFSDDEIFKPGGRKWASSTSSNWPVWKWVHINTVAPFKSFRTKIRKWNKMYSE